MLRLILALWLATAQGPLVITNDSGGVVGIRAARIAMIGDRRVEIVGYCASVCTMYLAASNVCVAPDARFMFHGPSFFGIPLPAQDFEYWSNIIAAHYPASLAAWFMETGRYGVYTISGVDVIGNQWAQSC